MIAIIDYDAGNLTSVERAVRHLGIDCQVTRSLDDIDNADRIIFPGVGAAGSAMESLRQLGLAVAIRQAFEAGKPILGICLGAQIVLEASQEDDVSCLGLIKGCTRAFESNLTENGQKLKVPHMGWNNIAIQKSHPVLEGIRPEHQFYFVHSYYPAPKNPDDILAVTRYGKDFASALAVDNLVVTQFHPEKSGEPGLKLLKNFSAWKP
ncbi:MAG: imidazole glycerol phosphate synthase subunit HisH [Desulfatibacillaceae bacterium]|nr:imidazole glycerol phosphate synthase subunit HisH [Desulfatibacillaceae bacterium]